MTGSQDCTVRVWDLAEVNQVYGIEPEEEDKYAVGYHTHRALDEDAAAGRTSTTTGRVCETRCFVMLRSSLQLGLWRC